VIEVHQVTQEETVSQEFKALKVNEVIKVLQESPHQKVNKVQKVLVVVEVQTVTTFSEV
jgi:hypothetical protein